MGCESAAEGGAWPAGTHPGLTAEGVTFRPTGEGVWSEEEPRSQPWDPARR